MIKIDDLVDRGYKEYKVSEVIKPDASAFYQKKIHMSEDEDDNLFIDAYMYDYRKFGQDLRAWEFSTQLGETKTFNVSTVGWEETDTILDEVEEFFKNLYYFSKHIERKE